MLNLLCLASGQKSAVLYYPNKWNQSFGVTNKVVSKLWCSQQNSPTGSNIFISYPFIDFFFWHAVSTLIKSLIWHWSVGACLIHSFNSTSFIISPTWVNRRQLPVPKSSSFLVNLNIHGTIGVQIQCRKQEDGLYMVNHNVEFCHLVSGHEKKATASWLADKQMHAMLYTQLVNHSHCSGFLSTAWGS